MVHPIKLKSIPKKIDSTRAMLLEEESNLIIGRKGMILKNFKTEKQRVVSNTKILRINLLILINNFLNILP